MAKIIQHQIFYPNPVAQVWDYFTVPALIAQWLMPNNFEPVIGHQFTLTARPMPDMNFDGIFYCEVLEVAPFKKLSYSWHFGPGDGSLNKSVVNWTFTEKDNGTEVLLIHNAFAGASFMPMFTDMTKGWAYLIKKLQQVINPLTDETTMV